MSLSRLCKQFNAHISYKSLNKMLDVRVREANHCIFSRWLLIDLYLYNISIHSKVLLYTYKFDVRLVNNIYFFKNIS